MPHLARVGNNGEAIIGIDAEPTLVVHRKTAVVVRLSAEGKGKARTGRLSIATASSSDSGKFRIELRL